ncbi:hypothetical protein F7725_010023 [Dissostichus mawsoni]|uniref:Platelet-derived growth factor receptor-like protein n=1 Tax=Dissostichus mawsoni TaxID=36200 RepID=A0A7J5XMC6_DISMA|nr:hypothetical protein F7725_010023 [Dissostichus mawsoni]
MRSYLALLLGIVASAASGVRGTACNLANAVTKTQTLHFQGQWERPHIEVERPTAEFTGTYKCVYTTGSQQLTSSVHVYVKELRFPPFVVLETDEYVRIVGEKLKIRCTTHNPNFNYNVTWKYTTKSKPTIEENVRSNGENRLDIESILTIAAVDLADTGNITCTGTNEAGVNSSTTYLLVVDKAYIRLLPQLSPKLAHQGLSLEVNEGEDLELTVVPPHYGASMAHPNIPHPHTSTQEQKLIRYNNRYHATLQLKRMNAQEQGQYIFYAQSDLANASIKFQVQMYQRPVAVVRWENITTLTCTSFGYPAPRIIWYQCFGIRPTCNENTSGLQLAIPLQAPTVEIQREEFGAVEVESVLTVGRSTRRMTVECVAFNLVGISSDTFAMEVSDYVSEEAADWPLDIDDLLRFSYQVAQGLVFLAAKNMCWNVEPTDRPTFSKISQMIERLLGEQSEREQLIYQNVPQQVTEGEVCDEPKSCDGPCDRSCDHEEEEQPLMKTNNYQFC